MISNLLLVLLMKDHVHMVSSFFAPIFILSFSSSFFFLLITLPKLSICQEHNKYEVCTMSYTCGEISHIYYPFWGDARPSYCGRNKQYELKCEGNQNTSIQIGSQSFNVLGIDQLAYTMTMARKGLVYDHCSSALTNTSLNSSLFQYMPNVRNITILYDCPETVIRNSRNSFPCKEGMNKSAVYVDHATAEEVQNCKGVSIEVKVTQEVEGDVGGLERLNKALNAGFEVKYDLAPQECLRCILSNGTCGSNDKSQFSCFCMDGSEALDCSHHHSNQWNWKRKVGIGVSAAVVSGVAVGIAIYIYYLQKKKKKILLAVSSVLSKSFSSGTSFEDSERGHKYLGLHFFSYSELVEATNNFDSARKLGDGGFGTVYFGKLQDGRSIAVKRMSENDWRRVEQFMNEVEILTGLHHQNLVSLYGCTSRHSRELLLVYEYVPNGTVADHLHGPQTKPGQLSWHIRMNIAIETASALVYLHATDIIHRDVKTRNILLDNHYSVKVADFGLSRLLPNHVTHISTAPQGTPGYVDPEYNECYQLTDKSDVYSFGVVLIELISSMPAVDISRHRREINLSTMAIKKIRNGTLHELVDPTLGFESDFKVRKMINAVAELAFQCLQSSKDVRPSMVEVLQRLRDIQSDGKSKPEVMDIPEDDAVLLKYEPPQSPDSNLRNITSPPNQSE